MRRDRILRVLLDCIIGLFVELIGLIVVIGLVSCGYSFFVSGHFGNSSVSLCNTGQVTPARVRVTPISKLFIYVPFLIIQ